jgi:DNA-binding PadR family transcriptional regulator
MRTSSSGFDLPAFDLHRAVDGLREAFAPRDERHDVREAVLVELSDEPMHGYQLIRAIEGRSGGTWRPTPGEVYPTLQLLADEGLVTAAQEGERTVYTLTETGRTAAASATARGGDGAADRRRRFDPDRDLALPKAGARLAQAMSGFGPGATPEQTERAVAIVDEARRKLYAILAED